jgi:hypothetical protein
MIFKAMDDEFVPLQELVSACIKLGAKAGEIIREVQGKGAIGLKAFVTVILLYYCCNARSTHFYFGFSGARISPYAPGPGTSFGRLSGGRFEFENL